MPRRMSVWPTASHTRTPHGTGIIDDEDRDHPRQGAASTPASTMIRALRDDDLHAPGRGSAAVGPRLTNDHRRHEPGSQVLSANPLGTKNPPPRVQLTGRNPVPHGRRRYQHRGPLKLFLDNRQLFVLGPAPPPARFHHLKPVCDLTIVRLSIPTVLSAKPQSRKAAFAGGLHFIGREDDIITSAGYRIGPSEIEDCLAAHPAVQLAAAVGKPDPLRTEIVKAYVALKPGHAPSDALAREIRGFVRERLSAAEYPREIEFVDEVPLTVSGKVIRRGFRERAAREAGAAMDDGLA